MAFDVLAACELRPHRYPISFYHLELLQSPSFRQALLHQEIVDRLITNMLHCPASSDITIKSEEQMDIS